MNELKIEYLGLSDLKGYENNTRTHSEEQITQIANSIQEFGFTNPVLIDENNVIVAGHGRIEASKVLGLKKVPTIKLKGLSDTQIKALVIADNQIVTGKQLRCFHQ
jgi:ParB-like chromosome segregation protein Spo0J